MIITISGLYGSGGNEIGQKLAEKTGYPILDEELVVRAQEIFKAKNGDVYPKWWPSKNRKVFSVEDDIPAPGTAYGQAKFRLKSDITFGSTEQFAFLGEEAEPMRRAMLEAQTQAIEECTKDGNCILFGKCSNFILRDREGVINVFSKADLASRVKRIMNLYNLTMEKVPETKWHPSAYELRNWNSFYNMSRETAVELIESTDHRRAVCYEFITGEKWGDYSKFDYVFDCSEEDVSPYADQLLELLK